MHPDNPLPRLIKVQRPHILIHILSRKRISTSLQPQHHAKRLTVFHAVLQRELEVGEDGKQALELLRVLGVVCGRYVEA